MSFRTQKNVFTVLAEGRKGKMQTKANLVPLRGALRATCKLSVPKQSQMPKIQTKANFHPIQQNPTHSITFHHRGWGSDSPAQSQANQPPRRNSKPKPISTP